jgi:formamidopyrimidine-DNA glycosylase
MNLIYISKHSTSYPAVDIQNFLAALNKPISDLFCKGKNYFIVLSNDISIKCSMGMAGEFVINSFNIKQLTSLAQADREKIIQHSLTWKPNNCHFELIFSDEETIVQVFYCNDRFGKFHIYTNHQELCENVEKIASGFIGRFIITPQEWMYNFIHYTDAKLFRQALLEQKKLCSGIGNYLRIELFYYAKFHPDITIGQLTDEMKLNFYYLCLQLIEGHYRGTAEKVIYEKKFCPNGHQVIKEKKGGRPFHHCPVEQIIGL